MEDPSSYGLVRRRESGEVLGFLEKPDPAEIDTDEVNAGAYVIEPDVVDLIPPGRAGLDRARGLPAPGRRRASTALRLDGYWMDIGTPERYLQASWDILEGTVETELDGTGGPYVGPGAEVSDDAPSRRARSCAPARASPRAPSSPRASCSTTAGSAPRPRSAARFSPAASRSAAERRSAPAA